MINNNAQIEQVSGINPEQNKQEQFSNENNISENKIIFPDCSNLENKSNLYLPKTIERFNSKQTSNDEKNLLSDSPRKMLKTGKTSKTYGLRPRTELRKPSYDCDIEEKELPVEVVRRPRGQYRNSLMSKYRRRTANARERHRMKEINDAFSTLRGILPPLSTRRSSQVSMTKIRTLRLAASYIQALSDLLQDADEGGNNNISNSTISYYSDSILQNSLLQKLQTKTSGGNFHSTCNFKPKRSKKNTISNNQIHTENSENKLKSQNDIDVFKSDRIPQPNSDAKELSESDNTLKHSWDISHMETTDRDLIAMLEENSSASSEIEGNFNSWVDYKSLEDLYFALN